MSPEFDAAAQRAQLIGLLIAGAVAGVMAGLFAVGGGALMVPVLLVPILLVPILAMLSLPVHRAVATASGFALFLATSAFRISKGAFA